MDNKDREILSEKEDSLVLKVNFILKFLKMLTHTPWKTFNY